MTAYSTQADPQRQQASHAELHDEQLKLANFLRQRLNVQGAVHLQGEAEADLVGDLVRASYSLAKPVVEGFMPQVDFKVATELLQSRRKALVAAGFPSGIDLLDGYARVFMGLRSGRPRYPDSCDHRAVNHLQEKLDLNWGDLHRVTVQHSKKPTDLHESLGSLTPDIWEWLSVGSVRDCRDILGQNAWEVITTACLGYAVESYILEAEKTVVNELRQIPINTLCSLELPRFNFESLNRFVDNLMREFSDELKASLGALRAMYAPNVEAWNAQGLSAGLLIDPSRVKIPVEQGRAIDTDNDRFKRWFKNSRVVTPDGQPRVVYHGTNTNDFSEFETYGLSSHFGTAKAAEDILQVHSGRTSSKEHRTDDYDHQCRILPVYLSVQNPVRLPDILWWHPDEIIDSLAEQGILSEAEVNEIQEEWMGECGGDDADGRAIITAVLSRKGYDGVVYSNVYEDKGKDSWIVFSPTQIKSAIGRERAYDPSSPDFTR